MDRAWTSAGVHRWLWRLSLGWSLRLVEYTAPESVVGGVLSCEDQAQTSALGPRLVHGVLAFWM
jgi:hypothetical protein